MKVFICSPYDGLEENYFRAVNYCKYVIDKGHIPICPVTMYHGVLNDKVPVERSCYRHLCHELQLICDEIWVFGQVSVTENSFNSGSGKPIKYIKDTFRFNSESEILTVLCQEYETKTGKMINRGIVEDMLYYLNLGLTDKLIIAAIKKTAMVSAAWNYTSAILKRCAERGIKTAEELKRQVPQKQTDGDYATYDMDLFEKMLNQKD